MHFFLISFQIFEEFDTILHTNEREHFPKDQISIETLTNNENMYTKNLATKIFGAI